jgi:hypothetical protein
MINELEQLRRARPEIAAPSEEVRAAARRALERQIAGRTGRVGSRVRWFGRADHLVPALGMLIVIAVVAVFLSIHTRTPTGAGTSGSHHRNAAAGLQLTFRVEPTPQVPVVGLAAIRRAVTVVRERLDSVAPGVHVSSRGDDLFVRVTGQAGLSVGQVVAVVSAPGRLLFYDWEANVLTPSGKPVAAVLPTQDPSGLEISQGAGAAAPGSPGAGGMALYPAVAVAARQPAWVSGANSRVGRDYFMFGPPGSPQCTAAARYYGVAAVPGQYCYLAGPQGSIAALRDSLPSGVNASASGVQTLAVKQGWVLLQAVQAVFAQSVAWANPSARFYVLRDDVAMFGSNIAGAKQSTFPSGSPDIGVSFTEPGRRRFEALTSRVAHRGAFVSGLGQTLNQHFAVALDTQLVTVPSIDFETYPEGVLGANGAVIPGGFTTSTARQLAAELRVGALPVHLRLVSINGHLPRVG